MTTITAILQILNNIYPQPLSYHRDTFVEQILWQWITPSLVHLNWTHWLLNILNLYASIILFHTVWTIYKFVQLFMLSSIFILSMLHIFTTQIDQYVGMSGVLYTLAIYGAIKSYHIQKIVSSIVITYIIFKLILDTNINHIMGVDRLLGDVLIVTSVHWYGASFAILFLMIERFYSPSPK